MKRTRCGACGYDGLEQFLDLGTSPIADAYEDDPDALSPRYPLQLAVCTGCLLVQLLEVVPAEQLFGTGYSFYSSASAPLSAYQADYADDVLDRHGRLAKQLTVEVGCNDGDLLRHFRDADCPVVGVDPATGPAWKTIERGNMPVLVQSFGRETAEQVRELYGPAGVVIANHVLAHVESVSDVLDGVQHLLADDGVLYAEVQYLPDLLVNNAFDLVYHEHRNFFSLTSLEAALGRWGLHVEQAWLTDRQGGSLRVVASKRSIPSLAQVERIRASETWLRGMGAYRGFQGRVDRIRTRLLDLIYARDGHVCGYGAPAKATTLLNFCGIDSDVMCVVVDTTTAKQNRYVPGTGALIVPPDEVRFRHVETVLILAWNYASTIIRQHPEFGGRWIVPIPAPVLL